MIRNILLKGIIVITYYCGYIGGYIVGFIKGSYKVIINTIHNN